MQERPTRCKSGAPTQDGSRSSNIEMNTSSILEMVRHLMYMEEKMKKLGKSLPGRDTMVQTRDGRLSILIKLPRLLHQELMKTLDSTSTDHSTSNLDFQWEE